MSLIRPVIRMCCVAALRGNTWAEDRVFDSRNTALVTSLTEQTNAPYIGVYTDTDDRTQIEAREIYSAVRNLSLVVELGVASAQTTVIEGSPVTQVVIPYTDEGIEAIIDGLESQVVSCLFGDPRNEWAELLRQLIPNIRRVPSHRGGSSERTTRWAARQLTFICDPIYDLPPGVAPDADHPVMKFIEMAEGMSPILGPAAKIVRSMLHEAMPDWRQVQAWLTLTDDEIAAIGHAPLVVEGDEIPPTFHKLIIEDEEQSPPTNFAGFRMMIRRKSYDCLICNRPS